MQIPTASLIEHVNKNQPAEIRLWTAVLARTLEDWTSGTLRARHEAEAFLFSRDHEADLRTVCQSAGLDPDCIRERLHELRPRYSVSPAQN
jgi:hypothetical protein